MALPQVCTQRHRALRLFFSRSDLSEGHTVAVHGVGSHARGVFPLPMLLASMVVREHRFRFVSSWRSLPGHFRFLCAHPRGSSMGHSHRAPK